MLLAGPERAEVGPLAGNGLGGDDAGQLLAGSSESRCRGCGTVQVFPQGHGASLDSACGLPSPSGPRRARPFRPAGPTHDRWSRLLSLGQDPRWRRFLVSRIGRAGRPCSTSRPERRRSRSSCRAEGCSVVGVDQSPEMLAAGASASRPPGSRADPARRGRRRAAAVPDAAFDALTFTYLLRYVEDPAATLAELARVVRPGGTIAALEFGLPRGVWRPLWELYVRVGLPVAGRLISPGWHEVGPSSGPSIREFHARLPLERQLGALAGGGHRGRPRRRLSLGGGYVVWGRRGVTASGPRSTHSRRAAGATTSRCSTRRTRSGTSRTSRSARRWRRSSRSAASSRRSRRSSSRSGSAPMRSTS